MNYTFRITETIEYEVEIEANDYNEAAREADICVETGAYQNETPSNMYVANVKCINEEEQNNGKRI